MRYYENFTQPMLAAMPSARELKDSIFSDRLKQNAARDLANTKLPAVTEFGNPVLVANLSMMDSVADHYYWINQSRFTLLRQFIDDNEYYAFVESLPPTK